MYRLATPPARAAELWPADAVPSEEQFDQVVLGLRQDLLQQLQQEPAGHARHLRAYVRCVCARLLYGRQWAADAAFVLTCQRYKDIWRDFVEEVCANDLIDEGVSWRCRSAVEALWLAHALLEPLPPERIVMVRENLLYLCGTEASDEPYCTH